MMAVNMRGIVMANNSAKKVPAPCRQAGTYMQIPVPRAASDLFRGLETVVSLEEEVVVGVVAEF